LESAPDKANIALIHNMNQMIVILLMIIVHIKKTIKLRTDNVLVIENVMAKQQNLNNVCLPVYFANLHMLEKEKNVHKDPIKN
jgi:hypothetical protein